MIALSSAACAVDAVGHARRILATAYLLPPGAMLRALEAAARRGAQVTVRLEGRPFFDHGALSSCNQAAVHALARLGADARLVDRDGGGPPLHMKAAVCDGVAYLDDRNFTGRGNEIVLRDDSVRDVRAIRTAAADRPPIAGRSFWTTKSQALQGEARMLHIARRAQHVDVESESFTCRSSTYAALKRLAQQGVHCRLIVSKKELDRRTVALLENAGVRVRAADFNEKFALIEGRRAWVGSANATSPFYDPDQIDWGARTSSRALVRALHARFRAQWEAAKPVENHFVCQRARAGGGLRP
jgi:phosphatidylserine/phosphatidylglycerophosphate/cardiolipin synthase-like enzyme